MTAKLKHNTVNLICPEQEHGKVIKVQKTAPNSIKVEWLDFQYLLQELTFLQDFYKKHSGPSTKQPTESTMVEVPSPDGDPDKTMYGFRGVMQGEIKWPPKESE